MQRRVKVPDQSVPAAIFADETRPSTVLAGICADGMANPITTASVAPTPTVFNFIATPSPLRGLADPGRWKPAA
jgi:hypothetical protein